jgi:YHS domain-containing protein
MSGLVQPVFIFLPVEEAEPKADGGVVDPVCGRVLRPGAMAGRVLHAGRFHYLCSLGCIERFASSPKEYDLR